MRVAALVASTVVLAASGCGSAKRRQGRTPQGPTSEMGKQSYIKRAIRSSNEGVIVLPSKRAEFVFELPRLNEIAHTMRQPMAACFLGRAVRTMNVSGDPEQPFTGVPEGQLKIRARIAPSGEVVRAEVLETGFADTQMEPCLTNVVRLQRWPENQGGNTHYIDIVYWVSLGFQGDTRTPESAAHLKREQVAAGIRAKPCLRGRVDAGTYDVQGLNLVSREGGTMANRIDHEALPESIRKCIAKAFQSIRLPRQANAFVRPVAPTVRFTVAGDGAVGVQDEDWLTMLELEERAVAARSREPVRRDVRPTDALDRRAVGVIAGTARGPATELGAGEMPSSGEHPQEAALPRLDEEPEAKDEPVDPGQGGLRLNLGGRG